MRSQLLVSCLVIVSSMSAAEDQTAAVRAVVQKYAGARDQPDPQALAKLFTPEVDQLVSSGEWRKGQPAVVSGAVASSQRESGKRTITIESVRFLAETVALADGRYELADATGNPTRKMWTSIVLTREGSGWRIAAIRNMLPAPAAR